MKNFRKNEQDFFICEECGRECINKMSLSKHLVKHKITLKEYYDKWLKENNEGYCDICGKETEFRNFTRFYKLTCSKECNTKHFKKICIEKFGNESPLENKKIREKIKETNLKKYGVNNPFSSLEIRNKIKQSCLEKYGVENPYQSEIIKEKCKQTKLQKYGDEKFKNWEKQKQTCLERYGVEYVLSDPIIRQKAKETMKLKYGVEHQSQNENIHKKQMFNGKRIKQYKDTNIWYQGTFELDFLEKYFNKFEIQKAHSIKYEFNNKNKYYHPDFFIPFLNLIIEIKNSYYAKIDKDKIDCKQNATINNGYNYIMIVNKNYEEFEKLLKSYEHK